MGLGRGFALSLGLAHYPEVCLDDNFETGATHGRVGLCLLAVHRAPRALQACTHAHLAGTLVRVRALQPIDPGARLSGGASVGPSPTPRVGPLLFVLAAELFVPVPRLAFQLVGSDARRLHDAVRGAPLLLAQHCSDGALRGRARRAPASMEPRAISAIELLSFECARRAWRESDTRTSWASASPQDRFDGRKWRDEPLSAEDHQRRGREDVAA